jgi:hypothetical protein
MKKSIKDTALELVGKGKSIIPVGGDKKPLLNWQEYQTRRPTKDEVLRWFDDAPGANIAMPTGKLNGVVVIDCDSDDANRRFLEVCPDASKTLTAKTPRGFHYYFQHEEGVRNDAGKKLGEGIDIRGDGGYVLIPPSVLDSGHGYSWNNLATSVQLPRPVADAIIKVLDQPSESGRDTTGVPDGAIHKGGRNQHLTKVAGSQRRLGLNFDEILDVLTKINETRCIPPLRESELVTIARSVTRYEPEDLPTSRPPLRHHDLVTIDLSTVKPQPIKWLWKNRIPIGARPTLIEGDGGVAKSWLTMDIAAHVSTGKPFHDGWVPPRGNVIIISAEDDPSMVLVPRLMGQGADLSKISTIAAARDDNDERGFRLQDIDRLTLLVEEKRPKLIIIDPVIAYLGNVNMNDNGGIRGLLTPLQKMAATYDVAVILVRHLNKSTQQSSQYRGQGGQDFYSACGSVFQVIPDANDRDLRHLAQTKSNLGKWAMTVEFCLVDDVIKYTGENADTAEILHNRLAESKKEKKESKTISGPGTMARTDMQFDEKPTSLDDRLDDVSKLKTLEAVFPGARVLS